MRNIYRIEIGVFLVFLGFVILILLILLLPNQSSAGSSSNDSDFPYAVFIPIFIGSLVAVLTAITGKKRR